jgi:hypothetical protein
MAAEVDGRASLTCGRSSVRAALAPVDELAPRERNDEVITPERMNGGAVIDGFFGPNMGPSNRGRLHHRRPTAGSGAEGAQAFQSPWGRASRDGFRRRGSEGAGAREAVCRRNGEGADGAAAGVDEPAAARRKRHGQDSWANRSATPVPDEGAPM